MRRLRKENWLLPSKKRVKNEIHLLGQWKLLHWLLVSLACWLRLARRLCIYNVSLKVDTAREISIVVMTSYYKNVCSCESHSSLSCILFLAICLALSWSHDSLPLCSSECFKKSASMLRPLQLVIMFLVHRPHPFLKNVKFQKYMDLMGKMPTSAFWKIQISEINVGWIRTAIRTLNLTAKLS